MGSLFAASARSSARSAARRVAAASALGVAAGASASLLAEKAGDGTLRLGAAKLAQSALFGAMHASRHAADVAERLLGRLATVDGVAERTFAVDTALDCDWDISAGCFPDDGPYPVGRLTLMGVGAEHSGVATAMLREHYLVEGGDVDAVASMARFETVIGSCVEVALSVAMSLAEAHLIDDQIGAYHDPNCACLHDDGETEALYDSSNYDDEDDDREPTYNEVEFSDADVARHAGQVLTILAHSFEQAGEDHAAECDRCARLGEYAPTRQRARFARDLADNVLSIQFDEDYDGRYVLHGVPTQAAFHVLITLVDLMAIETDLDIEDQLDQITQGLAGLALMADQEAGLVESSDAADCSDDVDGEHGVADAA